MATRYYLNVTPKEGHKNIRPLLNAMTNYSHERRLDDNETYRITIRGKPFYPGDATDAMFSNMGFNFKVSSYLPESVVRQMVIAAVDECRARSGVAPEDKTLLFVSAGALEHVGALVNE